MSAVARPAGLLTLLIALGGCGGPNAEGPSAPSDPSPGWLAGRGALDDRVRTLVRTLEEAGWEPTDVGERAFLAERERRTWAVTVPADRCLALLVLASPGVQDLDATLYAPDGTELAQDRAPDPHPTLVVCGGEAPRRVYYHLRAHDGAGAFVFGALVGDQEQVGALVATVRGQPGVALSPLGDASGEAVLEELPLGAERFGFRLESRPVTMRMDRNQRVRLALPVKMGRCYTVVAVGLEPLERLGMRVLDELDREVAVAPEADRRTAVQLCADRAGDYAVELHAEEGQGRARVAVLSAPVDEVGGPRALWLGTRPSDARMRLPLDEAVKRERRAARAEGYTHLRARADGRLRSGEAVAHTFTLGEETCTLVAVAAGRGAGPRWLRIDEVDGPMHFESVLPPRGTRARVCTGRSVSVRVVVAARGGDGRYALWTAEKARDEAPVDPGVGGALGPIVQAVEEGRREGWKVETAGRVVRLPHERSLRLRKGCLRLHAVPRDGRGGVSMTVSREDQTLAASAGHRPRVVVCSGAPVRLVVEGEQETNEAHLVLLRHSPSFSGSVPSTADDEAEAGTGSLGTSVPKVPRRARCKIASHRSSKSYPAPLAILGSKDVGVMPGRVLTSRTYSFSPSVTSRSTRLAPVTPRHWFARSAMFSTPR